MGCIYQRKWKAKDDTYHTLPTLWIKYRQNGRTICESTGVTKERVARRMLRTREGDVEKGIPINPKMGRITFEEAAKHVLNDYKTNGRKSQAHAKRRIEKALAPVFGGRRLIGITGPDVLAYVASRQEAKAANASINRELAVLKRMFSLAIKAGHLYTKPDIAMLKENNVRKGFFEAADLESVCRRLPEVEQAMVRFAYLTGWRVKSEILPLEWRQVDWQGRVVRLDPGTTKNGEGRSYPFTTALEALLKDRLAEHERFKEQGKIVPLLFHRNGRPIRTFRGSWVTACRAAGVPGRLLHDLRRTAVRNLERASVSRSAAMAMVGHKTQAIYSRYAIVDAGALRDAAAKIDAMGTSVGTSGGQGTSNAPASEKRSA